MKEGLGILLLLFAMHVPDPQIARACCCHTRGIPQSFSAQAHISRLGNAVASFEDLYQCLAQLSACGARHTLPRACSLDACSTETASCDPCR